MTKQSFIWLIIRVSGIFSLVSLLISLITYIPSFCYLVFGSSRNIFSALGSYLILSLNSLLFLILGIYLLFFGKWVFRVIDGCSEPASELGPANYTEISIRFMAMICLKTFVFYVITFLLTPFASAFYYLSIDDKSYLEAVRTMFTATLSQPFFWVQIVANGLLFWYFLKGGGIFINLLNRIWSGGVSPNSQSETELFQ